jgi:hypothetical protein
MLPRVRSECRERPLDEHIHDSEIENSTAELLVVPNQGYVFLPCTAITAAFRDCAREVIVPISTDIPIKV